MQIYGQPCVYERQPGAASAPLPAGYRPRAGPRSDLHRAVRYQMAKDYKLITAILGISIRCLFAWQRKMARCAGHRDAKTAAVTFVQRFGKDATDCDGVHFHGVLGSDGDAGRASVDRGEGNGSQRLWPRSGLGGAPG